MKHFLFIVLVSLFFIGLCGASVNADVFQKQEDKYQRDATAKRVSDVYEIAQLLEDCKSKQGVYPFVNELREEPGKGYVRVPMAVMLAQPEEEWPKKKFPFRNSMGVHAAVVLIDALENCLKQDIALPVDPQKKPYLRPNTYIVLFTEDNSYVVMAFLDREIEYTSKLADRVYAFAVSSDLGEKMQRLVDSMLVKPKKFMDIDKEEVSKARNKGTKMDEMFSKWAIVRVGN